MDAYQKGLNGVQAMLMWVSKKYHGHWVISLEALEKLLPTVPA